MSCFLFSRCHSTGGCKPRFGVDGDEIESALAGSAAAGSDRTGEEGEKRRVSGKLYFRRLGSVSD